LVPLAIGGGVYGHRVGYFPLQPASERPVRHRVIANHDGASRTNDHDTSQHVHHFHVPSPEFDHDDLDHDHDHDSGGPKTDFARVASNG